MILRKFVPLKLSTGLQVTPLKSADTVVQQNPEWFMPLPIAEACETRSVNSEHWKRPQLLYHKIKLTLKHLLVAFKIGISLKYPLKHPVTPLSTLPCMRGLPPAATQREKTAEQRVTQLQAASILLEGCSPWLCLAYHIPSSKETGSFVF